MKASADVHDEHAKQPRCSSTAVGASLALPGQNQQVPDSVRWTPPRAVPFGSGPLPPQGSAQRTSLPDSAPSQFCVARAVPQQTSSGSSSNASSCSAAQQNAANLPGTEVAFSDNVPLPARWGIIIHPGFTEHSYRLVFDFEDAYAPETQALTILPSGVIETSGKLDPKKKNALICFSYPQMVSAEVAQMLVEVPETSYTGNRYLETPFVSMRADGTYALIQVWTTNLNDKFKSEFEISVGVNTD